MHFKNGREANVGDYVVGRDYMGVPFGGVIVSSNAASDTCNVAVATSGNPVWMTYTVGDLMHADDALPVEEAPEEAPEAVPSPPSEVDGA